MFQIDNHQKKSLKGGQLLLLETMSRFCQREHNRERHDSQIRCHPMDEKPKAIWLIRNLMWLITMLTLRKYFMLSALRPVPPIQALLQLLFRNKYTLQWHYTWSIFLDGKFENNGQQENLPTNAPLSSVDQCFNLNLEKIAKSLFNDDGKNSPKTFSWSKLMIAKCSLLVCEGGSLLATPTSRIFQAAHAIVSGPRAVVWQLQSKKILSGVEQ